jgi:hypothetical protein
MQHPKIPIKQCMIQQITQVRLEVVWKTKMILETTASVGL